MCNFITLKGFSQCKKKTLNSIIFLSEKDNDRVILGGILISVNEKVTKNKK